jgi:hypothetical protein
MTKDDYDKARLASITDVYYLPDAESAIKKLLAEEEPVLKSPYPGGYETVDTKKTE